MDKVNKELAAVVARNRGQQVKAQLDQFVVLNSVVAVSGKEGLTKCGEAALIKLETLVKRAFKTMLLHHSLSCHKIQEAL